ncbi:MAG: acyltransferase [Dysgonamonadaceae bacterium]|jgi:surface polysaccharide O-acyltransferase-like enzyme|nr:acyltransferase [Dysgonamonadaceae bacterium]
MTNKISSQNLQSQVIDFLRFPLIVGVLFIHNKSAMVTIANETFGSEAFLPLHSVCSNLLSVVLGGISVPLFFFISGFLFFLNIEKFNIQSYGNKLRTRTKTLLIPYLFWNLFLITIYAVIAIFPALKGLISSSIEFNMSAFLHYLWDTRGGMPIVYPFWFVRDLMVVVIFTPVIFLTIKYIRIYAVIILGILWYFNWWLALSGFGICCMFFFSAGAYFSINKRNIIELYAKIKLLSFILYPIIAVVDLLTIEYAYNVFIHKINIIVGILFCFNFVAHLFEKGKIKAHPFLSSASFFVFAIHNPFILIKLKDIIYKFCNPKSDIVITGLYFLIVIIVIFVALGIYSVLRKFLPKFTAVITGGR